MNVQKYLRLFEYKLRDYKDENSGFWSFKLDVIKNDNPDYQKMSDLISNREVSEDSAYTFTIEALEAIKEIQQNIKDEIVTAEALEVGSEELQPYSEAPIYNSELLEWFSKGTNYTSVEDAIDEYGGKNQDGKTDLIQSIGIGYTRAWEAHYFKVLEVIKEEDKKIKTMQQFA